MKVALVVTIQAEEVLHLQVTVPEEVVVILLLMVVLPDHILQAVVVPALALAVIALPGPIPRLAVEEVLILLEVAEVHQVVHPLVALPEGGAEGASLKLKSLYSY